MHFCSDCLLSLLAMIPFIGLLFKKLHAWWHTRSFHHCHKKGCDELHTDHFEKISVEDAEYLSGTPAPLTVLIPVEIEEPYDGWDKISQEDLFERVGQALPYNLINNLKLLGVDSRPQDNEFEWVINDQGHIQAMFRGRVFIHDGHCKVHTWEEIEL